MAQDTHAPSEMLPLTPTVFHLLLALADGEKHGYAMMQAVKEDTNGQVRVRIGSLYGALQRMVDANLIEESEERPVPELDDERRRYYRLTPFGKKVLKAETQRLSSILRVAQTKRVLDEAG